MKPIRMLFMPLLLLLAALCLLGTAGAWNEPKAEQLQQEKDLQYYIEDGSAIIYKYLGSEKTLDIPETLGGYSVTGLHPSSFFQSGVEELTLPNSVKRIGMGAFCDSALQRIRLPDKLQTLGKYAFLRSKLREIDLPASLRVINREMFMDTPLERVSLPPRLLTIASYAFAKTNLKEITLPGGLKLLGKYVFQDCKQLQSIKLPASIETLWGFNFGSSIKTVYGSADSVARQYCEYRKVLFIDSKTGTHYQSYDIELDKVNYRICSDRSIVHSAVANTSYGDLVLPAYVEGKPLREIRQAAFEGANLRSVVIPDTVSVINDRAFALCQKLRKVVLPKNVECIGAASFSHTDLAILCLPDSFCACPANGVNYWDSDAKQGLLYGDMIFACRSGSFAEALLGQSPEARYYVMEEGRTYYTTENALYSTADGKQLRLDRLLVQHEGLLRLPDSVNGLPVTEIGPHAFALKELLRNFSLWGGEALRSLAKDAFRDGCPDRLLLSSAIEQIDPQTFPSYKQPILCAAAGGYCESYAQENGILFEDIGTRAFSDLDDNAWYFASVQRACRCGYMAGTGKESFSPGLQTTRAMLVQVLYNLSKSWWLSYREQPFRDVEESDWYAQAVSWATAYEYAVGTSADYFSPESPITREQAVTILYRYAKKQGLPCDARSTLEDFTDTDKISPWAEDSMRWAVQEKLVFGTGQAELSPQKTSTRAELAALIERFINLLYQTQGGNIV